MPTRAKSSKELAGEMAAQAKELRNEGKAKQQEAARLLDAANRLESAAKALR